MIAPRPRTTLSDGIDIDPADPPVAGAVRRDRALDALRGIAICAMVAAHVSGRGIFTTLVHGAVYVSAADWFVLLSGVTVGMRAEKRFARGAGAGAHRVLLRRAGLIYLAHCGLTLGVLIVHRLTGRLDAPGINDLGGTLQTLWMVTSLQVQPHDLMNILPLYVLFLLGSPLCLEAMRRGLTSFVLLASAALWLLAQRWPSLIPLPSPTLGPVSFSVAAWQFAFVVGLVLGYHRHAIAAVIRKRPVAWPLAALTATMLVVAQLQRRTLSGLHLAFPAHSLDHVLSKETWGAARALYATLLLSAAYWTLKRWNERSSSSSRPITRVINATLTGLQSIGRKSLRCFVLHLPLALAGVALGSAAWPRWAQELSAATVILIVYGGAQL
jgi:hypothetical protein